MDTTEIDVIIVNWNTPQLTDSCIQSIKNNREGIRGSIIVVDNGSTDESVSYLRERHPDCRFVLLDHNIGYGAACNHAVHHSSSSLFILSNSDVIFTHNCIAHLVEYMSLHNRVGVSGVQQVYPDGSWQRSSGDFPGILSSLYDVAGISYLKRLVQSKAPSYRRRQKGAVSVEYVDGAVMCFRRTAFDSLSGFDEAYYFFVEDVDICFRLRREGWGVVLLNSACAIHHRGGTRSTELSMDLLYLERNMQLRYQFIRTNFSRSYARVSAVADIAYYAEMMMMHSVCLKVGLGSKSFHQKRHALCKHIVSVCVESTKKL